MLTSTSSLEDHLDVYLANRPYVGKSSFPNKAKVKSAGAKFSGEARLWYAPNEQVLRQLLETEVWTSYPTALSREQMLSLLTSRSENEQRAKHREECNALKKEGPSESRVEEEIVKLLLIPPDSEAELGRLADWNVTPQMLEISKCVSVNKSEDLRAAHDQHKLNNKFVCHLHFEVPSVHGRDPHAPLQVLCCWVCY